MSPKPAKDWMLTIEGTLVMFVFIDPHCFVVLTDSDGTKWTVEWESAKVLSRQGVASDTLKPGEHIVVVGYPAAREHQVRLENIARPLDNWEWRRH